MFLGDTGGRVEGKPSSGIISPSSSDNLNSDWLDDLLFQQDKINGDVASFLGVMN
jgi:hypothetical protein